MESDIYSNSFEGSNLLKDELSLCAKRTEKKKEMFITSDSGKELFRAGQRGQIRWQNGNMRHLQETIRRIVFMFTVRCENG